MNRTLSRRAVLVAGGTLAVTAGSASGQKKYDVGVTDTEIKLGTTAPYSGPASTFGVYGQAMSAYFKMMNERGGINGRKIDLISLDDGYSPPKTVEQTRRLVERDEVFFIAGALGTAPNAAIQKYLNARKVPHVFLTAGGERFNDHKNYPYSIPLHPTFVNIGRVFAHYILGTRPDARIAVLYLNDDLGKDHLAGLRQGLGARAQSMIVQEVSHEITDPLVDSQVISLRASGADTLLQFTTPKFGAQIIRKVHDLDWKPLHIMAHTAASVGATLTPAGLDKSVGIISVQWFKDVSDPAWAQSPDMVEYLKFISTYMPGTPAQDPTPVFGYFNAAMMSRMLERCGDDLTRDNVLRQATSHTNVAGPMLLPGITINNSPTDYSAFQQLRLIRFDGTSFRPLGDLIDLRKSA